jgi:hypothetical protein
VVGNHPEDAGVFAVQHRHEQLIPRVEEFQYFVLADTSFRRDRPQRGGLEAVVHDDLGRGVEHAIDVNRLGHSNHFRGAIGTRVHLA